jgi:hypothetical protein
VLLFLALIARCLRRCAMILAPPGPPPPTRAGERVPCYTTPLPEEEKFWEIHKKQLNSNWARPKERSREVTCGLQRCACVRWQACVDPASAACS